MSDDYGYVYDLVRKLGGSDFTARTAEFVLERPLAILLILLGAVVVSRVVSRLARRSVESLVSRSTIARGSARSAARARTLAGVAASLIRILVWSVAVLLVLDKVGINLGPLLAGASIVGVALGFGAQSLVKDFLSGFFILAEDQFGVGDVITVSDTTGTVEEVNLRITRLRGADGTVWFVPNGEIRKVGNSAKDWSKALVDIVVPEDADIAATTAAMEAEAARLKDDPAWADALVDAPEVLGVEAVGTDGVTLRVAATTDPDHRARVARELRGRIMTRLRADGVLTVREPAAAPPAESGERHGEEGG
ncbi:MAG TPA: mechanosensitive ion channel family protein [Acidimicrobiales bacterium]|nr:mechanosensitive ion channel family protein [Acidimicrobiales bacterium]